MGRLEFASILATPTLEPFAVPRSSAPAGMADPRPVALLYSSPAKPSSALG